MPIRHSAARHHSHSNSLGAANHSHRVTRRKSMNASAVNSASIVAALQEDEQGNMNRRSWNVKTVSGREVDAKRYTSRDDRQSLGHSLGNDENSTRSTTNDDSAVADDFLPAEHLSSASKTKARRASEGSYLTKGDGKRSSGELRCEKCGKGYKHSSCLTKHLSVPSDPSVLQLLAPFLLHFDTLLSLSNALAFAFLRKHGRGLFGLPWFSRWEHTPEWSYTSKLLISKHQQVQLLEAASVLVGMNQDTPAEQDNATSENSSASPAASGSSDVRDDYGYSSAETTPPPMSEHYAHPDGFDSARGKRYSGNSSSFSRSYQSAPSSSLPAGSTFAQHQSQRRPSTSGLAAPADQEEASLAAAVASLCSFGTPQNRPVLLPPDVPPVPPLPAQYVEHNANRLSGHMGSISGYRLPAPSYQRLSDQHDVDMDDDNVSNKHNDYDYDERSVQGRSDDDDDGVFGTMEGLSHDH
jgi:hypothetical protein